MITKALLWGIIILGSALLAFVWVIISARKECKKGFEKKKKFLERLLDVVNEANLKVKEFQLNMYTRKVRKEMEKEEEAEKKKNI